MYILQVVDNDELLDDKTCDPSDSFCTNKH